MDLRTSIRYFNDFVKEIIHIYFIFLNGVVRIFGMLTPLRLHWSGALIFDPASDDPLGFHEELAEL